ncbi:unnamed protein product, partial [Amoebophrya sp. A120]|eukprot:GSA120T00016307001.1
MTPKCRRRMVPRKFHAPPADCARYLNRFYNDAGFETVPQARTYQDCLLSCAAVEECTGFNFHKRGFPPQSSNCLLEKNSFETGDMTHVKWQTNYDYDVTVVSSGCRSQLLKFLDPWKASFRLAHVMTQIPIPTTCVRDEGTTLVGGTDLDGSFSYGSRGASKFSSFEECMLTCAHYPTCNGFVRDPTNGCLLLGWAADASITKSAQSYVDAMEMTAECRKSVLRESE